MSSQNIPSTPSRIADRLPFPQSHNPSPTQTFRSSSSSATPTITNSSSTSTSPPSLPPSTSTTSSSSTSIKPTTAPVSLTSLLATHASAANPHLAALEQALSERNLLSTQNSQLWKLIEKQRSGYNQLLKELERVRSERDALRVRVKANGGLGDKDSKSSSSNSAMRSASSGPSNESTTSREVLPLVSQRHHADDIATPRNEHHQLPPLRTQDQQESRSPQSAHPKTSSPPFVMPVRSESLPVSSSSSTSSLPVSSPDMAHPQTNQNTRPGIQQQQQQQQYPQTPIRNGTPTASNTPSARSSLSSSSHSDAPTTARPPPPTLVYSPVASAPSPAPHSSVQTAAYSLMMQAALAPSSTSTTMASSSSYSSSSSSSVLTSIYLDPTPPHNKNPISRESRISLPDEAKRYIASMGDSPAPSPKLGGFQAPVQAQVQPQSQLQSGSGRYQDHQQQQGKLSPPNTSAPNPSPMKSLSSLESKGESEFLDLDDEDIDASGPDDDEHEGEDEEDGDLEDDDDDDDGDEEPNESGGSMGTGGYSNRAPQPSVRPLVPANGRNIAKGRTAADDFPLPPGFGSGHVPIGQTQLQAQQLQAQQAQTQANNQVHGQQMHYARAEQPSTQPPPSSSSQQQRSTRDPEISPPFSQIHVGSDTHSSPYLSNPSSSSSTSLMASSQSQSHSLMATTAATTSASPAFRALPLLATDLPYTRICVSQSSIRPNDRGKEVLSFTVEVDPGHGKESWKVEKLYSDVLGLDQRIRASVGKGVGKKIGNLPEGKLWRDHAPAKVDQRKATLEAYLQTLINLPVKNKDEVIAFFCSDIVRETKKPVYQAGYKEGYLTKRGKNFGGWKTRYFVLQGPVLEYYESRGGAHLGSITITGAQIGRQQRTGDRRESDDEKEYRHAFLIIEAKKSPSGSSARHVLCAESDSDRDDWVEVLVRYVMGSYNDDSTGPFGPGPAPPATGMSPQTGVSVGQPRSSTSSITPSEHNNVLSTPNGRKSMKVGMSKDDIVIAKGPAVPISQLAPDATNMKLFQTLQHVELRTSSPSEDISSTDRKESSGFSDSDHARRILEKGQPPVAEVPLSSSLPTSSPLDGPTGLVGTRANSELGHYSDMQEQRDGRQGATSPERHRPRERKVFQPTLNTVVSMPNTPGQRDQDSLQDNIHTPRVDAQGKAKISGPLGGTVIPAGYKFGGKDAPAETTLSATDRREKAKSRSFWGFGKNDKQSAVASYTLRAVFGVTLEESLDVVEIANLPAVVFRCIQYLEAKKADQEEGIYRLSGSSAVIKSLKDRFNTEGDVDLLSSDEYWDPHAIAGLLKSYLRELPASILTRELHLRFLSVIDFVDPQERIKELSHLIASLPIANYSLLRALTAHLILIVQNAGINKMTMRNVGIVFSPTLGIPAGVFSLMLGEFNRVFNVDAGGDDDNGEEDSSHAAEDPIRRNSRQYSDAAADQLLGLSGRSLTAPVEEGHSDADNSSVDYESGPESTEDNATVESSTLSSLGAGHHDRLYPDYGVPPTPKASKATQAAATRGLNIAVSNRGNRHSRIMLPASPRPGHSPHDPSPPVPVSPMHTPK